MTDEKKEPEDAGSGDPAAKANDGDAKANDGEMETTASNSPEPKAEGEAAQADSGSGAGAEAPADGEGSAAAAEPAASEGAGEAPAADEDPERAAKIKAAQEARAARAAEAGGTPDPEREARIKAAQEAKAARLAAAGGAGAEGGEAAAEGADAEKEAKVKAAAEARAARARAKAAEGEGAGDEPAAPKEPSPKQPRLDQAVNLIKERISADAIEEAYINEIDAHLPYLIIKGEHWAETAKLLKNGEEFRFNYLRNLSGTDQETHLEVAYHLLSLDTQEDFCVKVKTDRETPSIPSVTPLWATANWNEREVFDLLGIDFPGHPDLRRIMMPDDWVGHPLRKDYEPIDPEV